MVDETLGFVGKGDWTFNAPQKTLAFCKEPEVQSPFPTKPRHKFQLRLDRQGRSMISRQTWCALIVLAMFLCRAGGAQPPAPIRPVNQDYVGQDAVQPEKKPDQKKPDQKKLPTPEDVKPVLPIKPPEPGKTDIFGLGPQLGQEIATGFNPHMMGDFATYFSQRVITVTGFKTITTTTHLSDDPNSPTTTMTTKTPFSL